VLAAAVAGVRHHVIRGVIGVTVGAAGTVALDDGTDDLVGPFDIAAVKEIEFDLSDPDGGGLTGAAAGAVNRPLNLTTSGTGDANVSLIYRSVG
jgi:hypothetical protein